MDPDPHVEKHRCQESLQPNCIKSAFDKKRGFGEVPRCRFPIDNPTPGTVACLHAKQVEIPATSNQQAFCSCMREFARLLIPCLKCAGSEPYERIHIWAAPTWVTCRGTGDMSGSHSSQLQSTFWLQRDCLMSRAGQPPVHTSLHLESQTTPGTNHGPITEPCKKLRRRRHPFTVGTSSTQAICPDFSHPSLHFLFCGP